MQVREDCLAVLQSAVTYTCNLLTGCFFNFVYFSSFAPPASAVTFSIMIRVWFKKKKRKVSVNVQWQSKWFPWQHHQKCALGSLHFSIGHISLKREINVTGFKTGEMKQEYVNAIELLLNEQEDHCPPYCSVPFHFLH